MIDIHNHIIPNIDDGSDSLELSRKLLFDAKKQGISDVCITPHYMDKGPYKIKKNELLKIFNKFKKDVKDIDINLYLGHELYIDKELDNLLLNKQICSMNDSDYVLIEFPFDKYEEQFDEYLYNVSLNYKIIIAHPERYDYVLKDYRFVDRWLENGYTLQANQTSLFINKTRKCVFNFIEKGELSFISSDCHNLDRPLSLIDAYKLIERKYSKEIAETLFNENPLRVISNKPLIKLQTTKKRIFNKWI